MVVNTLAVLGFGAAIDMCPPAVVRALSLGCFTTSLLVQVVMYVLYACGADGDTLRAAALLNILLNGLGNVLPFDISPQTVSMRLGGADHAPMLIGLVETPGFFCAAIVGNFVGDAIASGHDYKLMLMLNPIGLVLGTAAWWAFGALDATRPLHIQATATAVHDSRPKPGV
jgi:cyanate permease